jgi:hypothetical protein
MTLRPSAISLRRRFAWLMLLVGALLARGLTPDGWMPVASAAGGFTIAPCDGHGPSSVMAMPMGKPHHKMPPKGQTGDHPCVFSGIGIADATPPLPTIVAPVRRVIDAPAIQRVITAPGRGLAAPPPPATGPPALV